jgi:hypothetical protein
MARAFLIEPTKVDTAQAEQFGEVVTLFPDGCRRSSIWSEDFASDVCHRLASAKFAPNRDYIIASGPMATVLIAILHVSDAWQPLRLLIWDAAAQSYQPFKF